MLFYTFTGLYYNLDNSINFKFHSKPILERNKSKFNPHDGDVAEEISADVSRSFPSA